MTRCPVDRPEHYGLTPDASALLPEIGSAELHKPALADAPKLSSAKKREMRVWSVRQAIISVAYQVRVSDVKTGTGRRTIDVDARTVGVMRAWRKALLAERMLVGPAFANHDLVFPRPDGTPTHPDAFSQTFDRAVVRLGLPVISLHDLRHTHATLLLRAGVPVKVVSERLGHANPAFTMTVYQHVIPGMQEEAASLFSDLIFGRDEPVLAPAP